MFNFHDINVQTLTQFFETHPHSAGIFVYFICFLEALAVIGAFIPGTIAMPAIGFLIGLAVIPAGSTVMWAILGALTGDILSYFIGVYFQDRIHRIWPFTRWPTLLERSEKFFHKHGGKSVFIGRFVGPMRAMIPMIAGMFKMSVIRFLFVALLSALLWVISYMIPGALLGALSLELPAKLVTKFALWGLLVFAMLWVVVWLTQHFFRQIWQMIDYYIMQLWRFFQRHKKLHLITKFLSDPREADNHLQLMLTIMAIFFFTLFLWVLYQVLHPGILVDFGHSVYHLLSSLRFERLDHIFILTTFFGDVPLLMAVSVVIALWFLWKRQLYVAVHWLGILAFSGVVVASVKFLINSSRPGDISYAMHIPSFPSAHTVMSFSFYCFLAVIIARQLQGAKKYLVYIAAGILTVIIAFSRIYLGAHWLIDILGGILLGLTIVFVATVFYRRRHVVHLDVREFLLFVIGVSLVLWLAYSALFFEKQVKKYTLMWPKQVIAFNELIKGNEAKTPLYRLNRLGSPIEAFNVIYVGNLTEISQALLQHGWEPQPIQLDLQNILKSFSKTSVVSHLTIFPQLYQNRRVALLFTKETKREKEILILRLWSSGIDLKDSDFPLWIGTVEYHYSMPGIFSFKHPKGPHLFNGAAEFLSRHLEKNKFFLWKKHYPLAKQPPEMRELNWDGKLLIIKAKPIPTD